MLKRFLPGSVLALCMAIFAAPAFAADKKDIVETAAAAGSFKTLLKACTEAGLVDTLKGAGPFTVFAPTDEAFAKVPASALEALLKDKEALKKVLLSHVYAGKVDAKTAMTLDGKQAEMVSKTKLMVKKDGDALTIGGSKIVKTDIECSNGMIHVIDTVILPSSK